MTLQHKQITVVAIDDHELILHGIRYILDKQADIQLVAEGHAGNEIVPLVAKYQPAILLLDIGLPEERTHGNPVHHRHSVFTTLQVMKAEFPRTRTIIVSQYGTQALAKAALSAGVKGYLIKDDALTDYLVSAIRSVHGGGIYFSRLLQEMLLQDRIGDHPPLQPRQIEILTTFVMNPDVDGLATVQVALNSRTYLCWGMDCRGRGFVSRPASQSACVATRSGRSDLISDACCFGSGALQHPFCRTNL